MSNISRKTLWENLIKNVIIIFLLVLAHSNVQTFLLSSSFSTDKSAIGSLLVAVSILAVTACFGNFAFTYAQVNQQSFGSRLLAHLTTGLLMLLIGLSLEMTSSLSKLLVGDFFIFDASLLLLYSASVLYDFWDLKRSDS